jgi:hypothetical protein
MDFRLTPDQEAFRKEVSDFLDKEGPQDWHKKKVSFLIWPASLILSRSTGK